MKQKVGLMYTTKVLLESDLNQTCNLRQVKRSDSEEITKRENKTIIIRLHTVVYTSFLRSDARVFIRTDNSHSLIVH